MSFPLVPTTYRQSLHAWIAKVFTPGFLTNPQFTTAFDFVALEQAKLSYADFETVEFWEEQVDSVLLPVVKVWLARSNPPSTAELFTLPEVRDTKNCGVYMGLLTRPGHSTGAYGGSATGPSFGLTYRCGQHESPAFRATPKEAGKFFYRMIKADPANRLEPFRILAKYREFQTGDGDILPVTIMKLTLLLAENMLIRAFNLLDSGASIVKKEAFPLWPWESQTTDYIGLNSAWPLQESASFPSGYIAATTEERHKAGNDRRRVRLAVDAAAAKHRKEHDAQYEKDVRGTATLLRKYGFAHLEQQFRADMKAQKAHKPKSNTVKRDMIMDALANDPDADITTIEVPEFVLPPLTHPLIDRMRALVAAKTPPVVGWDDIHDRLCSNCGQWFETRFWYKKANHQNKCTPERPWPPCQTPEHIARQKRHADAAASTGEPVAKKAKTG
ncbi:hypothetical protein BT63DRAFT_318879 [Microthyrium microscopicum]|uniref:Uncharacterized protein n=1 Tax=Microthyrium microscopicum TaxID=703497 RepID=A0A6A6U3F5_9PEZI|nr:hypothetical protein BT63DRAFT_318879 [Microthyrium microscopicum]